MDSRIEAEAAHTSVHSSTGMVDATSAFLLFSTPPGSLTLAILLGSLTAFVLARLRSFTCLEESTAILGTLRESQLASAVPLLPLP